MATSLEAALGGPEVLLVACEVDEGNQLEGGLADVLGCSLVAVVHAVALALSQGSRDGDGAGPA